MAFTLRIFMVDLIAFVFDSSNTFWALLPDARNLGGGTIPNHYPVLIFDDGKVHADAGDWVQIKSLLNLTAVKSDVAWLLNQEDVRFSFTGTSLPPTAAGSISKPLPDLSNRQSFEWVPIMANVSSQHRTLNSKLVNPAFPTGLGLSARLNLPSAQPATFAFSKMLLGATPLIYPATFPGSAGSAGTTPRALADVVVARYAVTSSQITISAGSHAPATFTPPSDPCDILLTNISPSTGKNNTDPHGHHFKLYFPLSNIGTPSNLIPVLDVTAASVLSRTVEKEPEPTAIDELDDLDSVGALSRPVCTFVQFDQL
jgi:hypothetical protein